MTISSTTRPRGYRLQCSTGYNPSPTPNPNTNPGPDPHLTLTPNPNPNPNPHSLTPTPTPNPIPNPNPKQDMLDRPLIDFSATPEEEDNPYATQGPNP